MTKRQPHELQRPLDCNTDYADGLLAHMEAGARCGNTNQAARLVACKWLSVFVVDGELAYKLAGRIPHQHRLPCDCAKRSRKSLMFRHCGPCGRSTKQHRFKSARWRGHNREDYTMTLDRFEACFALICFAMIGFMIGFAM